MAHLALIFAHIMGREMGAYLQDRVFAPIGIEALSWDLQGGSGFIGPHTNAHTGIHISARELARFGYLALHHGVWNGEQLIPAWWMDMATRSSQDLNPTYWYTWWVNTTGERWPGLPRDAFALSGYLSNRCYIIPSLDLVVARVGSGPPTWDEQIVGGVEFLRRRIAGDYETDEFGFDPDLTDHLELPVLRPLFSKYFRVETQGLENVPSTGGALVVANHSGTLPVDALMTAVALHDDHPAQRRLRLLGADLVFDLPFIGTMSRKMGTTLACNEDAERLLTGGELVGVFPEGFKGIGKPFRERYTLQRFGRGGFVTAALRTGVPIIPCAIVGAEEIYPMIGNAKTAARLLGLPYFPVTPTFPLLGPLGLVPLPSKWLIAFGEPIETASFGPAAAEDPMLVFNLTDQVRETIQHSIYQLLLQRKSVWR